MPFESTKKSAPEYPSYLLRFAAESATLVPLPTVGEVFVAVAPDGGLNIGDAAVQNPMAKFASKGGAMRITVVDRRAELLVNGTRLEEEHRLVSGDEIQCADELVVFHCDPRQLVARSALDIAGFRGRLKQEVERALRYGRLLSVLAIDARGCAEADCEQMCEKAISAVRMVDVVGWDGSCEVVVIFPETSETAAIPAKRVLAEIARFAPEASAGLVMCPSDGSDADTLLTGARRAALAVESGTVGTLERTSTCIEIADQSVVAVDPKMKRLFALVERLSKSDIPILITGETGVGKELIATALHVWSQRSKSRMVSINSAAVPETLLESELFGYERGAFDGADTAKPGLLEKAMGGTVFLDEVSECSLRTQAKLLRVIETNRSRRVGATEETEIDVRFVAATNRSLVEELEAGRFREDLFYRLSAAAIAVPPLRDRMLDLPVLARFFLNSSCEGAGRPPVGISEGALRRLQMHDWPGNVRELKNLMDYVVAVVADDSLAAEHIPHNIGGSVAPWMVQGGESKQSSPDPSRGENLKPQRFRKLSDEIRELEKRRIEEALAATDGVRVRAAELIGMPLRTFVAKLKVHGLSSPVGRRRDSSQSD